MTHILGNNTWEQLWNWLGDREVFFCSEKNNVFSNSKEQMLECFELLHQVDDIVFWRLYPNAVKRGMCDVMGSFLDSEINNNQVGVFMTHNDDGGEIDVIEQWKVVSMDWWSSNKDKDGIRTLCELA